MKLFILAAAVGFALSTKPALSCTFHGYTPQPTAVEKMLSADAVVLARVDPLNIFRFRIVEVLKGQTNDTALPFLVDSATRRKMAVTPDAGVLFAINSATGKWERLAFVDHSFDPVLRAILIKLPEWQQGPAQARAGFFGALINHPNQRIRELALRELDLSEYRHLRTLDLDIDADIILARLHVLTEADLRAIRILLLGMSDKQGLESFFKERLSSQLKSGGDMIGAYTLAFLENGGPDAIDWLLKTHLVSSEISYQNRSAAVQAMFIQHKSGNSELTQHLQKALSGAVFLDTELASMVVQHFGTQDGFARPTSQTTTDVGLAALQILSSYN